MILGLSVPTFTLLHVIISLIGIGAGIAALLGMAGNNRLEGWTALFLLTTALTSITGFFFHSKAFGPPHVFGVVTLVVMVPVLLGRRSSSRRSFSSRCWSSSASSPRCDSSGNRSSREGKAARSD
jgi:hypothetical protein